MNQSEYETQVIKEVEAEIRAYEWYLPGKRLKKAYFVSKSKGKGRKRKHWEEVLLIHDDATPGKWTSYQKFPFDEVATEVLPHIHDGLEAEAMLMREYTP